MYHIDILEVLGLLLYVIAKASRNYFVIYIIILYIYFYSNILVLWRKSAIHSFFTSDH